MNSSDNLNAFASNQSILAIESQATEISPSSAPNSSQLYDTNTTTSEAPLATSPQEAQHNELSGLVASESAIDLAVEDSAPASSVPQIVEAQESDLRDMNSPFAQDESPTALSHESSIAMIESDSLHLTPAEPVADTVSQQPKVKAERAIAEKQDASAKFDIDEFASEATPNNLPTPPTAQEDTKQEMDFDQGTVQMDSQSHQPSLFGPEIDDIPMDDAPAPKLAREREDDDELEPSAKRAKTEGSATESLPAESASSTMNGYGASAQSQITEYQEQEMLKALKNIAQRGQGKNFKRPVVELWPSFADAYLAKVHNPIDLGTMQTKIINKVYQSMEEVKADAQLLYDNAVTFNGADHDITKGAAEVKKAILSKTEHLPTAPAPAVKKDKKKRPAPTASGAARAPAPAVPSRRQSHSSTTHTAPVVAQSETYAVGPEGVPRARKGSVISRPKRAIHPPKKDLPAYSNSRPKNKKFANELRFCEEVLSELQKPKHHPFSSPFLIPVDPVALGIPSYFAIVKRPMDLSTISRKLKEGSYSNASQFDNDVRLMLANCFKFNPTGNPVHVMGRQMEALYDSQWSLKDQWMADHAPAVASPASDPESSEGEDEEEEIPEAPDMNALSGLKERLLQEQTKLIEMMQKKGDQTMIQMQQEMVELIKRKVDEEEANAKKKVKKPKAPKPAKKVAPPVKKAAPKKQGKQGGRYMGTLEKETISNGLGSLPDHHTSNVLEWIQADQGNLSVSNLNHSVYDIL